MHRNVEVLIGRLATDPELLRRFVEQPFEALRGQQLELSPVELAALAATDPEAIRAFAQALDARLRRAARAVETRPTSGETHHPSEPDHEKENPS